MSRSGLPAGNYLATSTIDVVFSQCIFCIGDPTAFCYIDDGHGSIAGGEIQESLQAHDDRAVVQRTAPETFAGDGNTIGVYCQGFGQDIQYALGNLVITRVDQLSGRIRPLG